MATVMSAALVRNGSGIPDVCSRHGEPPTRRRRIVIESSPPGWTYALIPFGMLPFGVVRAVLRRAIVAPVWPFCDRCRRRRGIAIAIASVIVAGGLAEMVLAFRSSDADVGIARFAVGLAIAMLGYIGFHWVTPAAVAGARLTRDGQLVTLRGVSTAFEARLPAAPPTRPQWMPATDAPWVR
jgi:hypothetical protein